MNRPNTRRRRSKSRAPARRPSSFASGGPWTGTVREFGQPPSGALLDIEAQISAGAGERGALLADFKRGSGCSFARSLDVGQRGLAAGDPCLQGALDRLQCRQGVAKGGDERGDRGTPLGPGLFEVRTYLQTGVLRHGAGWAIRKEP